MKQYAFAIAALLAGSTAALAQNQQSATMPADAINAARVRELQIMLNSANLRCNLIGVGLQSQFESFSTRQGPALARAVETLKQYFNVRTKADLRADYDRYQFRLLNFYGTGRTDRQSCEQFGALMTSLASADQDGVLLGKVAEIMVAEPLIETSGR